jgi:hypothetical protein
VSAQPSPAFYFASQASLLKFAAGAGATVTATLASLQGVNQVAWTCYSSDDTTTAADYPLTVSGPKGSVCTFPANTVGTGMILECVVNDGVDPRTEAPSEAMRARAKCYVPTTDGLEVGCFNEGFESGPQGWLAQHNAAIRAAGASNNGTVAPTANHLLLRGTSGDAYATWFAPQQAHLPATGILRVPPGPQIVIAGRDDADATDRAILRWISNSILLGYSSVGGPESVALYAMNGASLMLHGEGNATKGQITATAKQGVVESMGAALVQTIRQSGSYTTTGATGIGGGITGAVDGGGGTITLTTASPHGTVVGDVANIVGIVGTVEANGIWPLVNVPSSTTLQIAVPFVHAYTSGGTIDHVGGVALSLLVPPDGTYNASVRCVATGGGDSVMFLRAALVISSSGSAVAEVGTAVVETIIDDNGIGLGAHHWWLCDGGFLHLLVGAQPGDAVAYRTTLDLL